MHYNTISSQLKQIIETFSSNKKFSNFFLCGGTSLSLQIGHRISVDADFISEKEFDKDELIASVLLVYPDTQNIHQNTFGVFLTIDQIKVDFLSWNIPFIKPTKKIDVINLLSIEDIAAMKLFAILNRGEKKDYMDIATLLESNSLTQLLSFYKLRHNNSDEALVLRFLVSYSDIENQPEPQMLNGLNWKESKLIIASAIKNYINQN
jgi:predicted nucleotidyltransferase component of viral defense system